MNKNATKNQILTEILLQTILSTIAVRFIKSLFGFTPEPPLQERLVGVLSIGGVRLFIYVFVCSLFVCMSEWMFVCLW